MTQETETATPATPAVPARKMTATELKELKSLVDQDFDLLHGDLRTRKNLMDQALEVEVEKRRRAAREQLDKALKPIRAKIDTFNKSMQTKREALNTEIDTIIEDLNTKGFVSNPNSQGVAQGLNAHEFHIDKVKAVMHDAGTVYLEEPVDLYDAKQQIVKDYMQAANELNRLKFETQRSLALEFVLETQVAIDLIKALPTAEQFLALPAPIENVDLDEFTPGNQSRDGHYYDQ